MGVDSDHAQAFHRVGSGPFQAGGPTSGGGSFSAILAQQQAREVGATDVDSYAHLSTSPSSPSYHSPVPIPTGAGAHGRARSFSGPGGQSAPRLLTQFNTGDIKILLLENVSQGAVQILREQGYQVDFHTKAWSEEELCAKIGEYHVIGIRSKTKLTERVFRHANKLLAVGCFCIGTNQVDLAAAANSGIVVFNSPFANSRSVAELVIGEIIALSRQLTDRVGELKAGEWNKVSKQCFEIRGKTLGIIGYGHIGSQLSVLAEAMGMAVVYYDVVPLMPLGTAQQLDTLDDVLEVADFVTVHVPDLPDTRNMFGRNQFAAMKKGAYFLNNARGTVVDVPALVEALQSGQLGGAAIDVYPKEPAGNGKDTFTNALNPWVESLRACRNIILTPHIGGSTEEAQKMIGLEVASALTRYLNFGSSLGAVNFPEVDLRAITEAETRVIRICYVHHNQPGSLRAVNEILGSHNVDKQHTDSRQGVAYLMADISDVSEDEVADIYKRISQTPANILTRLLT